MERKIINIHIFILCICAFLFTCCTVKDKNISDSDMISFSKKCTHLFSKLGIKSIEYRNGAGYYVCQYTDSTLFIVSSDLKKVIDITNDKILSIDKDYLNPSVNLISLCSIIEEMVLFNICYVKTATGTVFIQRFDGYSITNKDMAYKNGWQQVEHNWYVSKQ